MINPATGEQVGEAANAGPELVRAAIDAASRAFPSWAQVAATERSATLRRIVHEVTEDADAIIDLIVAEQGKPRSEATFEVNYACQWLEWYAEEAKRVYGTTIPSPVPGKRLIVQRQPVGVAVAITPWNFPVAMIARKLAPALAAGCTLVVKPAEQTPLSPRRFIECLVAAEVPAGVVNFVTSENPVAVSDALVKDPRVRKITFTGSTEVGKLLVRESADHLARVSLELGGQAPFIVFDDADLEAAVAGLRAAKFNVAGQSCLCANRIYLHRSISEGFAERFAAMVKTISVGRGDEPEVDVGPLIDERSYEKVRRHVDDAVDRGAKVLVGGKRLEEERYLGGYFFAPTVIAGCTDDMLVAQEETFGPVAPLFVFDDEDEVITRANASRYGLAAYVYTTDLGRALRVSERLEYGIVGVNDPRPASPSAPFGGFKESGLGREGGQQGIDAFLETKLVSVVA